jgi:mediator of RNA polymerase II transcription subunit 25
MLRQQQLQHQQQQQRMMQLRMIQQQQQPQSFSQPGLNGPPNQPLALNLNALAMNMNMNPNDPAFINKVQQIKMHQMKLQQSGMPLQQQIMMLQQVYGQNIFAPPPVAQHQHQPQPSQGTKRKSPGAMTQQSPQPNPQSTLPSDQPNMPGNSNINSQQQLMIQQNSQQLLMQQQMRDRLKQHPNQNTVLVSPPSATQDPSQLARLQEQHMAIVREQNAKVMKLKVQSTSQPDDKTSSTRQDGIKADDQNEDKPEQPQNPVSPQFYF